MRELERKRAKLHEIHENQFCPALKVHNMPPQILNSAVWRILQSTFKNAQFNFLFRVAHYAAIIIIHKWS